MNSEIRAGGKTPADCGLTRVRIHPNDLDPARDNELAVVIGEGITSLSLANAVRFETGRKTRVLCTTECPEGILRKWDRMTPDEDDIIPELEGAAYVIADPLYKPIVPESAKFISLPSEAFSGRIYRDEIPDLTADIDQLLINIK